MVRCLSAQQFYEDEDDAGLIDALENVKKKDSSSLLVPYVERSLIKHVKYQKRQLASKALLNLATCIVLAFATEMATDGIRQTAFEIGPIAIEWWLLVATSIALLASFRDVIDHTVRVTNLNDGDRLEANELHVIRNETELKLQQLKALQLTLGEYIDTGSYVGSRVAKGLGSIVNQSVIAAHMFSQQLTYAFSPRSESEQFRSIVEKPEGQPLSHADIAAMRRLLLDGSVDHQPTVKGIIKNRLAADLDHKPNSMTGEIDIFRPAVDLINEVMEGFARQTFIMGLIGSASVVAYFSAGIYSYETPGQNNFVNNVASLFSKSGSALNISAAVAFWQMTVLLPYGSNSIAFRLGRFMRDNLVLGYQALLCVYVAAYQSEKHISFLNHEAIETEGRAPALYLIASFVKMTLLLALCVTERNGESLAGNLSLFVANGLGMLARIPLSMRQGVKPVGRATVSFVVMLANQLVKNPAVSVFEMVKHLGSLARHTLVEPIAREAHCSERRDGATLR